MSAFSQLPFALEPPIDICLTPIGPKSHMVVLSSVEAGTVFISLAIMREAGWEKEFRNVCLATHSELPSNM